MKMRSRTAPLFALAISAAVAYAELAPCPGNSRCARRHACFRRGRRPKEVLTFNDGPEPPTTARVLDIRERECVRTSFFAMSADEELLHLVAAPRQASTVSER